MEEETQRTRKSSVSKRRGLLAGATALGAALIAKAATTQQAEAANGDPLIIGQANTGTVTTSLTGPASTTSLYVESAGGLATLWTVNTGNTITLLGQGAGGAVGVQGESSGNAGIIGASTSNNPGVYGQSGLYGLWGQGLGGTGIGVYGAVNANQISSGALAALFDGPAVVNGNLTVNGAFAASGIKSAIVPNSRGEAVHLYSIEAPESFFEDFGMAATGADGSVTVAIDGDFKDVVKTDTYLVFITAYGRNASLFVESQGDSSFVVRDSANTAGVRFGWRIVAKRADVDAPRFMPASAQSRGLHIERRDPPEVRSPGTQDRPVRRGR